MDLVSCLLPAYDDDDDDDYTFLIQGSGVCIDQHQYKVPPLCPVLGVLPPWEENPSQTQITRELRNQHVSS